MINISKFLTVSSLLLSGIKAGASDWAEYELGLELDDLYASQKEVAGCTNDCMYAQEEYLSFFLDDCNICLDDKSCYTKQDYGFELNELYKEITQIIKWDPRITEEPTPIEVSEYGYYGYTVDVKLDKEYTIGICRYRTCETERFEIINGEIKSYKVVKIHIKSNSCHPMEYGTITQQPSTSTWEKSTTHQPSTPFVPPPSSNPSWSPTTPSPTTPQPTANPTPKPTWPTPKPTPNPTTAWPTTAEPTSGPTPIPTPEPTTLRPTAEPTPTPTWPTPKPTRNPTTAWPTTAWPTTAKPTTAWPTTAEPTTAPPTTSEPTPCPTAKPTTPQPTAKPTPTPTWPTPRPTPNPTTAEPTRKPTPNPVEPILPNPSTTMWQKSTKNPTPAPKKCNYNEPDTPTYGTPMGELYVEQPYGQECGLCDYEEKCVKVEDMGYGKSHDCSGICVPVNTENEY